MIRGAHSREVVPSQEFESWRYRVKLTGRTILITGGSAGIGLALATEFASRGNKVIITGRREAVLQRIRERYPAIAAIRCDAGDADDILRLAHQVHSQFPQLDVLVNNAGISRYLNIAAPAADIGSLTDELNVNVGGVMRTTSAFIGTLMANRGTIINVSSALAFVPLPCLPVYCASKAAIHSYTQSLRFQLENCGVEVIEVMPPAVSTDMTKDLVEGNGLTLISVDELVRMTFADLAKGRNEIHPGQSSQLALMRRIAPDFINRQLWKAAKRYVPTVEPARRAAG